MAANTIDITFLGTTSAVPSPTRNHASLALRIDGSVWLFDAGEGTQHRLISASQEINNLVAQQSSSSQDLTKNTPTTATSTIRIGRIEKIFITHMHGDHIFGLVGLLCTVSQGIAANKTAQEQQVQVQAKGKKNKTDSVAEVSTGVDSREKGDASSSIVIYGPATLRQYVRTVLRLSRSRLGVRYTVHEILFPGDPVDTKDGGLHPDEVEGRNIYPDTPSNGSSPTWHVYEDDKLTVRAAPILHSIPALGYVIQEKPAAGRLQIERVSPILQRNKDALFKEQNIKNPNSLLSKLKAGETLTMPDGTVITPVEFLEPQRPGRKIVILGDTCDPSSIAPLAMDADILIHEATNACLKGDREAGLTYETVQQTALDHGHSTPQMAGAFAKRINARQLVLNHFSTRYKGDVSEESLNVMEEIRQLAVGTFGSDNVVASRDYMTVHVHRKR
ncbi:hypothetical protein HK102_010704 [Quaeritorhiza haematococci]|nr:hypothetical protein HK102_010704 [Quaeritorhiza haematococci]